MIDKILSRLGIYDIIGILLSGALITYITKILIEAFWNNVHISVLDEPLVSFLICYFVGLIFQEFTSFIHKTCICKNENRYLRNAVIPKPQHFQRMEEKEIDEINRHISDKLGLDNPIRKDNIIYNYCKSYYYDNTDTTNIDRDQAIAAMARSLCFYCFMAVIIPLCKLVCLFKAQSASCCTVIFFIGIIILLLGFGILLYNRFARFTYRRIIAIYRYYLYYEVWGTSGKRFCKCYKKDRIQKP